MNLRKWRRARDKASEAAQAAANREAFGRTRGQKAQDAAEAAQRRALLEGSLMEPPEQKPRT
ncbi:DUF4169 family protein [Sediminicoccus sp. KRV36]|uniref:DUF4169 family protein n=1 Tax=Sediminicoccus sp. KRV36 TaxID=3133721 RepID=UPI00200DB00D|nr:DUF4169 family protein [Sediminicoccus rosea]